MFIGKLTECTSTIGSNAFVFLCVRNMLNSYMPQMFCKKSRVYFDSSDETLAHTDFVLGIEESVQPSKAELGEAGPYKVLLLSHVMIPSFSLCPSCRVSFMRM